METVRYCQWLLLGAFVGLALLGSGRALFLGSSGIRIIPRTGKWWPIQALFFLGLFLFLLLYAYELVAHTWPISFHFIPDPIRSDWVREPAFKFSGSLLAIMSVFLYGLGLRDLGRSWRMGVDLENPGPLMTEGIFAWSRNPIYLSFDLFALGTFLVLGNLFFLLSALLIALFLHAGILMEERYLKQIYGEPYENYCSRVNRYWGK